MFLYYSYEFESVILAQQVTTNGLIAFLMEAKTGNSWWFDERGFGTCCRGPEGGWHCINLPDKPLQLELRTVQAFCKANERQWQRGPSVRHTSTSVLRAQCASLMSFLSTISFQIGAGTISLLLISFRATYSISFTLWGCVSRGRPRHKWLKL